MTFLKLFGLIIVFLAPSVIVTTSAEFASTSHVITDDATYISDIQKWRAERLEEINGENGWTTLVGLFWLNEGQNRFGSDLSNDIVLPRNRSPKLAGSFHLNKEVVHLEARPGAGITHDGAPASSLVLHTDAEGKATVLKMGSLTFFVIKRGEKFGLRVKDKQHAARTRFAGLGYFPIDPNWRLKAKFEHYNPPKIVPIVNVLDMVENMISPGALAFEMNGKTYRLDPVLEKGSKQLFIIFADQTSGKESYGAGRYLYSEPPDSNGEVVVDFNKAHNPPCAFTKFATCPLPPRQNRLGLRIDAGEMRYRASGH
jgi:uncharacterized protein (DUF1684 family)